MSKLAPEILLTFIAVDASSSTPKYLQLYAQLRDAIRLGKLKSLDRMPSTRALAKELKFARNSVIAAYDQLTAEGYLSAAIGSGTYVSPDLPDPEFPKKKAAAGANQPAAHAHGYDRSLSHEFPIPEHLLEIECLNEVPRPFQLTVNSPECFPFQIWSRIAGSVYRKMQHIYLGYLDAQGYLPFREAIVDYLRINRSISCEANQIIIVNGARQALHIASEVLLKKGDQCWVEDPGYLGVRASVLRFGGKVCPVPVGEQGIDLTYAMTNYPQAKVAYITPSHQFPLGHIMPLAERMRLLEWCKKNNSWIVEDDYDSEFRFRGRPIPAMRGLDNEANIVYIGTFSKILFPALRLAYMVLPDAVTARKFTYVKAMVDRQSPLIDQLIMTDFMKDGHFLRHIRRMRLVYKQGQEVLLALLAQHLGQSVHITVHDAGMFLIAWLNNGLKAATITQQATEAGIMVYPVSSFCIEATLPEGLMLGFTGFRKDVMEKAVKKLALIIHSAVPE